MAYKCDVCGKFRKDEDIVCIDYSDGYGDYDEQITCKWCMSDVDFERYFPNVEREDKWKLKIY